MRASRARVTAILAVVAVAGVAIVVAQRAWRTSPAAAYTDQQAGQATAPIRFVRNPQPVPDFTVADLEGRPIASADWRGKVTIVNFWATWCLPCQQEIPDFVALQEKYREQLQIVGFSMDEGSADEVRRFVEERKINYRVAMAGSDLDVRFGGIMGLPTTFVVDPQGRIVQKHVGLISPTVYEQEVRALAGLPVAGPVETFDDTGQVSLANAAHATSIPGLDLSVLTPAQKQTALQRLNAEVCTCGCGLTLAQCRINDSSCGFSLPLAKQVVEEIVRGGGG